jgi:hypothetical protein
MRYQSFEERLARERNGGQLPFIDLVEPKAGELSSLLVVGEEAPPGDKPRRGRRPNPAKIDR